MADGAIDQAHREPQEAAMTLPALIERLSAASGPDRELDGEIEAHLHGGTPSHRAEEAWLRSYSPGYVHGGSANGRHAPHYTGSIDAAHALLPPDLFWLLAKGRVRSGEPLYGVQLMRPVTEAVVAEAEHDHLPNAIAIAAL